MKLLSLISNAFGSTHSLMNLTFCTIPFGF